MIELEEGGMFDEETMPDWMMSMRGVPHRGSIPPTGLQFPLQSKGRMPDMGQLLPGMTDMAPPPHEMGGMPPMLLMEGIHPPFGLPPAGGPHGLLGQPPYLLPPLGGPLLGEQGSLLLRPGFPHTEATMVSGTPSGFPEFDSSQTPPGVRMQGPQPISGVLRAPQGMPGGSSGIFQSPRPPQGEPLGLLGPSFGGAPVGQDQEQGPFDIEDQDGREFRGKRERGRGRDRRFGGMWKDADGDRGRCLVNKCKEKRHSDAVGLCLLHIRKNTKERVNFEGLVGQVTPTLFRKSRRLRTEFEIATAAAAAIMACPVSTFKLGHRHQTRWRKTKIKAEDHNKVNLGMFTCFLVICCKAQFQRQLKID